MKSVLISECANTIIKEYLKDLKYSIIEIKKTNSVYEAVCGHPDIYVCKVRKEIVVAKEQLTFIQQSLDQNNITYLEGEAFLGFKYPENIRYNAVQIGNHLVHNIKYTDKVLLDIAKTHDLELFHVKQGYTKCNLVVVDENSVITSDEGLCKSLRVVGIDVLLVQKGHVKLEGFDYGFLGGASGRIDNTLVFNGNLARHPDFEKIQEFIKSKGVDLKYFEEYPLEDIGSIIAINNE